MKRIRRSRRMARVTRTSLADLATPALSALDGSKPAMMTAQSMLTMGTSKMSQVLA